MYKYFFYIVYAEIAAKLFFTVHLVVKTIFYLFTDFMKIHVFLTKLVGSQTVKYFFHFNANQKQSHFTCNCYIYDTYCCHDL